MVRKTLHFYDYISDSLHNREESIPARLARSTVLQRPKSHHFLLRLHPYPDNVPPKNQHLHPKRSHKHRKINVTPNPNRTPSTRHNVPQER
jgi:hypothetical protein